jgi:hypothetical protein
MPEQSSNYTLGVKASKPKALRPSHITVLVQFSQMEMLAHTDYGGLV